MENMKWLTSASFHVDPMIRIALRRVSCFNPSHSPLPLEM